MAQRKKLPQAAVTTTIDSLAHDGRGIARVDGKVVFIDEALPGESLEFVYTDNRRDYAEGKVQTLHSRSAQRSEPQCPHFGVCGGCSFQHVSDAEQIKIKQLLLGEQFNRIGKLDIPQIWPALTGPHWGYRTKARMGVKYVAKKGKVLVGFRERRNPYLAEIDSCKVMYPLIGENLTALADMIAGLSIKDKIPQIEVAVGENACVLAFRVLEPPTAADQQRMAEFARQLGVTICLQPKGPDSIHPLDGETEVIPSYSLPAQGLNFNFRPAMFTQVNYEINRQMVSQALEALQLSREDRVLDLFCGLGNFTLPLATLAGQVIGVEVDQPLLHHARANAALNNLDNVQFHAADLSKDVSDQPWSQLKFTKVLLDPSRAGAAEILHNFRHWQPERIVYVSCNPSTLARDAGILVNELGYTLVKAGVMDMFPQTAHVESIALFVKS
ncbi:23S rRNA (uracil(1939)-C(5))-methyltransferase RlmD [Methylomonas paludis]|uniref:23S rRNA (uracil(1939)-C(5))-methyltransferase RlmD n=1 Tax=Methylomonas paludis TaxID=1173101 RepID=A0A975MLE0_9GAMM|nr:23S rRNA (uracil(1939)-C(5))-methyltransferase RlmD [Methylomonas paludis]QWF69534.1 23S rRNA (uracil(1939)-C(5))-methyltransferase RlmD [Methylomonas paludis]